MDYHGNHCLQRVFPRRSKQPRFVRLVQYGYSFVEERIHNDQNLKVSTYEWVQSPNYYKPTLQLESDCLCY